MTKDFSPAEALDLLDEIERLQTNYGVLTGRSAASDIDVRNRLTEHGDSGTLLPGIDADNALVALYAAGEQVSIFSDDDNWAEACWFGFTDDVQKALDRVGIYVSDDLPEVPLTNAGQPINGFEVMAVRYTEYGVIPASADDANAWGVYVTYDDAPTMHVEDYSTRTQAEFFASELAGAHGVDARTLPTGEVAA